MVVVVVPVQISGERAGDGGGGGARPDFWGLRGAGR
jgi:hypothetical protein